MSTIFIDQSQSHIGNATSDGTTINMDAVIDAFNKTGTCNIEQLDI